MKKLTLIWKWFPLEEESSPVGKFAEKIFYIWTEKDLKILTSASGEESRFYSLSAATYPIIAINTKGRNYTLKQHGFARDLPWQVSKQSSETAASLTLELNSNPATRQVYPFDFQLIFTYQLQGNSLKIHQKVINLSPERMPFSIGFHPYFQVTDKTRLSFDIPSSQYLDQRTKTLHSYSGNFDFNLEEIDAAFPQITRHQSSFSDSYHQRQIILGYDDLYTTIVFWTLKDKNYICLEPWSAPRNALNTGEHLTYLEPQSSREAIVEMRVNQI